MHSSLSPRRSRPPRRRWRQQAGVEATCTGVCGKGPKQTWTVPRVPRDEGEVPSPPPDPGVHRHLQHPHGNQGWARPQRGCDGANLCPSSCPSPCPRPRPWASEPLLHPAQSKLCGPEPWPSCGLAATQGAQAVICSGPAGRKTQERETQLEAHLISDLQRKHCPWLFQLRCPAPANEREEMRAGGTRMPGHAPVLAPGSCHPSHLSRHTRLPAPQGMVGPCTCVCGPGPSPWHRDDGFLQQQDLLTRP